MLTVRNAFSGAKMQIAVASGEMIRVGFVIPPKAGPFTCARVLVVGDLLRRVVEDVHSAQELADSGSQQSLCSRTGPQSDLMIRPVVGMFTTEAEAEGELGRPLDLVIRVAGAEDEPAPWPPTLAVAPVQTAVPYPDPATVRFALANANHTRQLDLTSSMLERSQAVLYRWRDRVEQWSHHPSQPILAPWRAAVIAAFDDDLDVARVAAMMSELEDAEGVEPGAKFEAFTYVDRVLAVDLGRHLGQI